MGEQPRPLAHPVCLGDGVCTNPNCPTHGITRPLLDRMAVRDVFVRFWNAVLCNSDVPGWTVQQEAEKARDSVMELARPVPTREQIAEALGRHGYDPNHQDPAQDATRCRCGDLVDEWDEHWADAVLALLNGAES